MKKGFLVSVAVILCSISTIQAAGGAGPCLATCFLGDTRIGLYMNDGKSIETQDWLVFGGNILGSVISSVLPPLYESSSSNGNMTVTSRVSIPLPLGNLYGGFDAYQNSKTAKGFCAGFLWGRRVGSEINTTKVRSLEILECIPIVNLYPCIAIPLEAYNGKTMTQVIQEENLTR